MVNYDSFLKILKSKGLTPYRVAKETGISAVTLTNWKNGAYTPKLDKLRVLADYLGVSVSAFFGGESVQKSVPILGQIACGTPIFAEENIEGYAPLCFGKSADFCLFAKGDSMIGARIYDGDLVYIKKQSMVKNGEIAVVLVEDSATLKRVYLYPDEKKLVLSPENPKYKPLVFIGEELNTIQILGKAVAFQSEAR
ncbi:MAG: helix-turn-helix domain-containing protein [Clostridia bacterium]|nr:helix-turn-helix domain-containing protein [Clostridia bacterium]